MDIKRELEAKRRALRAKIATAMSHTRTNDGGREITKDPQGAANLTHDDELQLSLVESLVAELKRVDRALEDVAAGRYGICRDCGEDIAPARLKVLPFAIYCVGCQSKLETAGPRRLAA